MLYYNLLCYHYRRHPRSSSRWSLCTRNALVGGGWSEVEIEPIISCISLRMPSGLQLRKLMYHSCVGSFNYCQSHSSRPQPPSRTKLYSEEGDEASPLQAKWQMANGRWFRQFKLRRCELNAQRKITSTQLHLPCSTRGFNARHICRFNCVKIVIWSCRPPLKLINSLAGRSLKTWERKLCVHRNVSLGVQTCSGSGARQI